MYSIPKAEQETVIRLDAIEHIANIYTCDPVYIRKFDKLAEQYPSEYKCVWTDDKYFAKKYCVDSRFIRFGKPASEAQRKASSENLKKTAN